jgi:hypothetical protein
MHAAPTKATSTPVVMIAAEKCGFTRAERRWWSGMSTMDNEAPRSTMSITDQKTMNAMTVIIAMIMIGKRSVFFSACMDD